MPVHIPNEKERNMAQQVNLTIKDTGGRVLGEYTLNAAGAPLQIKGVNNVYYELTDTASGRGPAAVSGTRSGDDLIVSIDNNSLIIKDYFTNGQGALVGMQADGTPYIYAVTDSAPEHLLASETGIATAAGSSLPPAAVAGIIGGVALTAGGIAIAKHNHDKHHHGDNITPQPQPNPTPNPQPNPNPNPQPNPQPNPNPNPQPSPQPNHEGRITITGEAKVGQTLTAAITDADGVPATGIRYQWYADGQVINGATGSSYTLTAAEKGKTITVQARYTDNANNAESPSSYATDAVREGSVPTPNHIGSVSITGEAKVGATLTAAISDSDGVPNTGITYQWLRDGVAIGGETNSSYTLTRDDAGHKIAVRAAYKDNAGHDETPLSAPLDIENTPPQANHEGTVTISGEAKVGSELTAAISDSDGVPTSGVTYQWLRDGVAISGQTGNTYQLTQEDAGHKITVRAVYKDNAGHDETPLSAPLDVENTPPQPNHEGTVTISGEAKVGSTLTATVTDADGTAQAEITYNWYADGVKIGEGANYTLTAAEKGKTITVRASYTDDKGTAENPTSDATATVTDDTPPPAYAPGVTLHGPGEITEGGKAVYTVDLDLAPLPKADTAAGLLDTLRHNAGHGILFGQHQGLNAGRADADAQGYKSDVHALTGHYPSIVGLAMMEQPMDRSKSVEENGKAMGAEIAKVDALGGIAAVSAHWDNPMPGPNGANDFSNVSLKRLLPGGDLNGTLNGWLDTVVAMAQHAVRADGSKIPFIFRPLHEGNGEWAWWYYGREGAETYKELFRYVVNYVKEHGADGQILTAFAPNGNFGGDESRYLQLYPGDDVVDILGYDGYDTNAAKPAKDGWVKEVVEDMAMLARMAEARGKVAALTEFGRGGDKMIKPQGNVDPEFYTDLLKGILADPDARKIAYMMTWANWGENDIYVPKEGEELAANFKAFVEQLLLTRVADRDITVDVTIEHGTTDDGDVRLSTQRVTIRKGESSATFTVEAVADGKTEGDEKYTVKISNPQGATIEAGKDSVATTVHDDGSVSPPTPLNHEGQITISGEAKVGSTLTATVSDADDFAADTVQYQWLRDGVAIDKATGSTYQLTNDDAGHKITVRATYKDNAGHDETPTSDATDIPAPPANHAGTVTISGEAKVGSTLTATVSDADEFAADKVQYQWLRDGVAIDKATGNTYQLTQDDAGHKITVRATYKDNAGHDETPLSPPTDTVTDNGATVNHEGTIRVEGTNRVGYTFTAVIDDADGVPENGVTYEWYEFYGKHLGSGKTITLTEEQVGMQLQVKASYTDNAGHHEDITSRFSGTVLPDHGGGTGAGINPPAADAPHVTLSGADTVKEGDTIIYTVSLDKPVDKDVSVDIKIRHGSTTVDDVGVRWGMQRATIKAGETSTRIWVDTAKDGVAEGNETYTLTISDAVYGTVYAPNVKPIADKVSAQSVFMLSYKYPLAVPNTDIYSDYWQAVHKAGSKKIPYVLVTPDAKPDAILDPGYVKVIAKNIELGFKNVVYVRTIQQTRDLAEVKAEIEKYFELYGKDNIHGIYLDEINPHSNAAVAYLAELYNYIKSQYGNKLVVANPGIHITDAIAPYADLFMLNESTADDYINHYENPTSAFENDPANAHRIMHTIYDASAADYDRIIELTRSRNAGWVYLTTDSTHPDGRPYNDLPQDFGQLVDHINDLGAIPADPNRSGTLPVLNGAYIDNAGVETTIIDADSSNRPGSVHIEGEAKVGSELTATVADSDDFAADKVQYQWLRDGVAIKDANGKTYQLTADDAGHKITVQATYKDNAGHDENPTSDATDIPAPPANHAGTVAITGEAKVGGTLTATVSDADNFTADTVQYQWLRDGVAISGETSSSYTLTRDDAGHKITVRAVYKDNAGHDENPTSDAADIPAPPANHAGTVTISGEALVGKTLTATIADGDGVDPAQAQYQWLVDGKAVNGATGATYEVRPEDAGKAISVHVEYTDNAAHGEKLDSGRADATVDHHSGYKLVWQDEFNGNALDENNWGYQTGGWNSSGVQNYYSAGDKNVSVSDGSLKITAHHESAPIVRGSGEDQKSYDFSSGFVQTQGKQAWTYGYFEARLKMPNAENGSLWPAFWMSPNEAKYGGWPRSGEIDILETRSYINNADRDHDGQIKKRANTAAIKPHVLKPTSKPPPAFQTASVPVLTDFVFQNVKTASGHYDDRCLSILFFR